MIRHGPLDVTRTPLPRFPTTREKQDQLHLHRLRDFQTGHADESARMLGQVTRALFEVGGRYRRNV